jgi:hypothetical protein
MMNIEFRSTWMSFLQESCRRMGTYHIPSMRFHENGIERGGLGAGYRVVTTEGSFMRFALSAVKTLIAHGLRDPGAKGLQ